MPQLTLWICGLAPWIDLLASYCFDSTWTSAASPNPEMTLRPGHLRPGMMLAPHPDQTVFLSPPHKLPTPWQKTPSTELPALCPPPDLLTPSFPLHSVLADQVAHPILPTPLPTLPYLYQVLNACPCQTSAQVGPDLQSHGLIKPWL